MGQNPGARYAQIEAAEHSHHGSEHRQHPRHEWFRRVQVSWLRDIGPAEPVWLVSVDISRGGIGLMSRHMVHTGSTGIVLLDLGDRGVELRGIEILHCRYLPGYSVHSAGARWIPLPDKVLLHIEYGSNGPRLEID